MSKLFRLLRYDWPIHFALLITNLLPDNVVFLRFRGWLVSHFLASCGPDLRIGRNITLLNPWNLHIGGHVFIAYGCWISGASTIRVGDETMFGPYCVVISGNHTRRNRSFRYGPPRLGPIEIGSGAWIAAHVTITAGAKVGDGALVAAGAVVNDDVPPDTLVAGQPAVVVKTLAP